jgi:cyanophycin synthetase
MVGMGYKYGQTQYAESEDCYLILFEYLLEEAGSLAADEAVRLVQAFTRGEHYPVGQSVGKLRELYAAFGLGPSTEAIVTEAARRGIPAIRLDNGSMVQLGYGVRQRRIQASMSSLTNCIAVDIAGNKEDTKRMLREAGNPCPRAARSVPKMNWKEC